MIYRTHTAPQRLVKCFECKAEAIAADALPQYVLRVGKTGDFVYTLAWLCWFCAYPVDAPLHLSACLVPLKSTRQQIPEETRPDQKANKTQ